MQILSVRQYSNKLKASIQSTGRLTFTDETSKILGLSEGSLVKFALDEEHDNTLFLIFVNTEIDEDAFRVKKSGSYYYLPTKSLFDALGYDYGGGSIGFDLIRTQAKDKYLNGTVYRMSIRNKNRNGGDDDVED